MTEHEAGQCVATQGCTNHQAPGLLVCRGHFQRFATTLRDIEDEALHLDPRPSMAIRNGTGGGTPASERASARLAAIAFLDPRTRRWEPEEQPRYVAPAPKAFGPWCLFCDHDTCTAWRAGRQRDLHDDEYDAGSAALASVLDELHNWGRLVREERCLSAPEHVTITGERDLLTRHLDWIAAQPWVDECFGDLRKLLTQLQDFNKTRPPHPEGTCYLQGADGQRCGGNIWRRDETRIVWRIHPDRCSKEPIEASDGEAYCERCGQTWDGADLDRLHLILEQEKAEAKRPSTADGRPMMTAKEIMQAHGMSRSAFDTRAHRLRQAGLGGVSRDGYYDPAEFAKATA